MKSLKGVLQGVRKATTMEDIRGYAETLDYSSHENDLADNSYEPPRTLALAG